MRYCAAAPASVSKTKSSFVEGQLRKSSEGEHHGSQSGRTNRVSQRSYSNLPGRRKRVPNGRRTREGFRSPDVLQTFLSTARAVCDRTRIRSAPVGRNSREIRQRLCCVPPRLDEYQID